MTDQTADARLVETWLQEIVTQSGQSTDVVRTVLSTHGVRAQTTLPRPHHLIVTAIHFEGIRPIPNADADEPGEAFNFTWELGPGVWCLASLGKNEAGKSSVLEIILWCLRGRSDLQPDVRNWLRQVRLDFTLDNERLTVELSVTQGIPRGTVTAQKTGTVLVEFRGLGDFEQSMDAFMLDRLGIEPMRTAQKAPGGQEDTPPITGELSWPSYASALQINRAGLGALLGGGSTQHALPTRLLELFLGAPWASTKVAAMVALKVVNATLSAARKRAEGDAAARMVQLGELTRRLEEAKTRLRSLPTTGDAATGLSQLYVGLTQATQLAADTQMMLAEVRFRYEGLATQERTLAGAERRAREAALARAFFHTLTPTVCPRCDTAVGKAQWERENDGHCSLCASDLQLDHADDVQSGTDPDSDPVSEADEITATLADVRVGLELAAARLTDAQSRVDEAVAAREKANTRLVAAMNDAATLARREAELTVARLEGAVSEREGRFADMDAAVDILPLEQAAAVLKAAESASHARRTEALKQVLDAVSRDITEMGQALGLEMLEQAELGSAATLTVWKGGQKQNYGSLTEGEQLRLKIVTTIALLRHGSRSGVGRHPGLLLVDSPGAEEVDPDALQHMVNDLVSLSEMVPELQVVIATARGAEVQKVIPPERMRLAAEGQRLW